MVQPEVILHVHDLPQLYQKPSIDILIGTLEKLRLQPFSFSTPADGENDDAEVIDPEGIPRYLTTIVSSSLSWLDDDTARELVWDLASARLSERSGRNAMPSMTRAFQINDSLTIDLFEPSLTEDNLGLKTWTSSLLLARRLESLQVHVPTSCGRVLELGAGTGLVGIAVSCLWKVDVVLTDLAEIVPNLQSNVDSNAHLLKRHDSNATVHELDWSDESSQPDSEQDRYQVIIAADPIYTKDHPKMLVDTVVRWLDKTSTSRFIVELPIREAYSAERDDLKSRLQAAGMELIEQGVEIGYDDWQGRDGRPAEVTCWWSVWRPVLM